jgi:hypothetical protein
MKLLHYGQVGSEKPGTLDAEGIIRDLSSILGDPAGTSLLPESLEKFLALNLSDFPPVIGPPRLGP